MSSLRPQRPPCPKSHLRLPYLRSVICFSKRIIRLSALLLTTIPHQLRKIASTASASRHLRPHIAFLTVFEFSASHSPPSLLQTRHHLQVSRTFLAITAAKLVPNPLRKRFQDQPKIIFTMKITASRSFAFCHARTCRRFQPLVSLVFLEPACSLSLFVRIYLHACTIFCSKLISQYIIIIFKRMCRLPGLNEAIFG